MDENNELVCIYNNLFPIGMPWEEVALKLNQFEDDENIDDFRIIFADDVIDTCIWNCYSYNTEFFKTDKGKIIIEQFLKIKNKYYSAFAYYMTNNDKLCLEIFKEFLADQDLRCINWSWFAINIIPYRNAFPEFWTSLKDFLTSNNIEEKFLKLVEAIELFYTGDDLSKMIDVLSDCLVMDIENLLVQEILGMSYYYNGDWRNAISYLENITETYLLRADEYYFMLGWAYGKIKDYRSQISFYEECVKINPQKQFAYNNLGYAYYRNKEFEKSEKIFEKCISEGIDLKYTSGNYVNTLLALGKIDKARAFVENPPIKLPKYVIDKVSKYKNKKKSEIVLDLDSEKNSVVNVQTTKAKPYQFSNEKILEDELTNRLEKGENVFGIPLHIYNHKGDRYGRQYIIPVGRLDLLAEDDEGNLYIIELKKDSGYGDVYTQIRSYIDWFEKNKKKRGRKIYGIICLNSPDKKLIDKIKSDAQVRLFEYAVTYTEYK